MIQHGPHPRMPIAIHAPRPLVGRRYRARSTYLLLWLLTLLVAFAAGMALSSLR